MNAQAQERAARSEARPQTAHELLRDLDLEIRSEEPASQTGSP